MDRRGRKRRLLLEDEYWQLIQSGVGTASAPSRLCTVFAGHAGMVDLFPA